MESKPSQITAGNPAMNPFVPSISYDLWSGDLELTDPKRLPLDDELADMCHRYAQSDTATRAAIRSSTSLHGLYNTLGMFCARSAVFAIRDKQPQPIMDGLRGIAMIELGRIDPRDILNMVDLLYGAGRTITADIEQHFRDAAALAEPHLADLINRFLARPNKTVSFGRYALIETMHGPGLVHTYYQPYKPSGPLHRVILELAHMISAEKYQTTDITIASTLPKVWLSGINDQALNDAIADIVAGAKTSADLRPMKSVAHKDQIIVVFMVELAHESVAQSLLQLSKAKSATRNDIALLGLCHDRLFCLVMARCVMKGGKSFETHESIQRFGTRL